MSCFDYPELYKVFRDHVSDEYIDEYNMRITLPDYEGDNPIEITGHDNIGKMFIKYTDGFQRPIPEIEPIIINVNITLFIISPLLSYKINNYNNNNN